MENFEEFPDGEKRWCNHNVLAALLVSFLGFFILRGN